MKDDKIIEVTAKDLPLSCPGKFSPAWSMHPKEYLNLSHGGEATCPYCGAHYKLKEGEVLPHHH